MTKSLTGIGPVKVGSVDDMSLDLPIGSSIADVLVPLPDLDAVEKFQSAMASGGMDAGRAVSPVPPEVKDIVVGTFVEEPAKPHAQSGGLSVPPDRRRASLPEERRTVGRDVPIAPHGHDGVAPMLRREDAPPCQSAELEPQNTPNCAECKDAVPYRSVTAQDAKATATDVRPVQIVNASETDSKTASKMQDAMVGSSVPPDRRRASLPEERRTVGCDVPPDGHEAVQVIAPAPLPIELPAGAVPQQPAATVATPDIIKVFVAVAEAVADAILVSTGFENGEGRILVRLQPEVLGGSEVQITAKGGILTVVVNPASQDVQTIVEANRTQFEQHLAEKVHSWRVAVAVKKGDRIDERV